MAWLGLVAAGIAVVSLVRIWTGADNLDSSGAIQAAITAAVPIALAGLSGLWSERAGVVNIGIEGMMVLGTFGAGYAGYQWGPWAGVFFGIVCGLLGGLLHALVTVTVGVDHIISGVAINILAPGLTLYLSRLVFTDAPGGGQRQSPPVPDVGRITLPWLSDWLGEIEDKGWFFVSDLAGIIRGFCTNLSLLSVLAAVLIALSGWVLWRTRLGLRLRSVGEAPYAAESLGVNVYWYKYIAVIDLRRAGRVGRGVPGGRPEVPGRADRRPRVHRAGRDDLRQLAARRDGDGRRACSATPTACSNTTRPARRCTRS